MSKGKNVWLAIMLLWLIVDSLVAIIGGRAESIDYFTFFGLLIIGVLNMVRCVWKPKK